jgi:hypothetical protein
MTQKDVINFMRENIDVKVTHQYFSPNEWIAINKEGEIYSEDGVNWGYINDPHHFEGTCLDPADDKFKEGWDMFNNKN